MTIARLLLGRLDLPALRLDELDEVAEGVDHKRLRQDRAPSRGVARVSHPGEHGVEVTDGECDVIADRGVEIRGPVVDGSHDQVHFRPTDLEPDTIDVEVGPRDALSAEQALVERQAPVEVVDGERHVVEARHERRRHRDHLVSHNHTDMVGIRPDPVNTCSEEIPVIPALSRPRVFVVQPIPPKTVDLLAEVADVEVFPYRDRMVSIDSLAAAARRNDYIFTMHETVITKEVIAANPNLKGIVY